MAQIRTWWLLALTASSPLTMAQMMGPSMPADHSLMMSVSMDHSGMSGWPTTVTAFPSVPTHAIRVGDKGHTFQPNNTKAKVGDTIEFQFYPSNHSVVRASFGWSCMPIEKAGTGQDGFFSGFYIIGEADGVPKWRWTLDTESTVYFYSSGNDDCNRYGMVGAINAKPEELQHQYDMALDSALVVQPDAALDQFKNPTTTSSTETSETKPTPSSTAPVAATESSGNNGLGAGGIAGVVVGAVAGIAIIAGLFYWYGVMRARQKPPTQPGVSPMAKSSYLSPGASSFDASSGMFSGTTVPSPPPQSAALGISPNQTHAPFVDGDTIYVPVKRSTIASGDITRLPSEIYNPAELYHPGMQGQNSDRVSWVRPFDQQTTDANSVHQTPTTAASAVNNKPSELSG